jgi:hypothetical protein
MMENNIAFRPEFIKEVKAKSLPKNCHPVMGLIEASNFVDAYVESRMSAYQLIQIVGCRINVSNAAAWILSEDHLNLN